MQTAIGVFLGNGDHEAQVRLNHFLLGDTRLALAFLDHVNDPAEFLECHASLAGNVGNLGADPLDSIGFLLGEGCPFLVLLSAIGEPVIVQFIADVGIEKIDTLHFVAFGKAKHLPTQCGQAAIEGVKIIDQKFDLGRVELNALDFSRKLLGKRLVFLFLGRRERLAASHHIDAFLLELLELSEQIGDPSKALDGVRLERGFHLSKGHGVVLFLVIVALGRTFFAIFVVGIGIVVLILVIITDGRTGGFFGDFTVIVFGVVVQLVGRGFLRQHGIEIENLA